MKLENFPAAHGRQVVAVVMVPGAHALHTVTVPPTENDSGYGHWRHSSVGVLWY